MLNTSFFETIAYSFVFGVNQENQEAERVQGSLVQPQWWKPPQTELLLRVTFRIPSNINNGAPVQKQPMGLTHCLFTQKRSTTDLRPDSKCGSNQRCCKFGGGRTASTWNWQPQAGVQESQALA